MQGFSSTILESGRFQLDDRVIDLSARRINSPDRDAPLTEMEVRLLAYLYDRRGAVVSREELLEEVWEYDVVVASRTRAPSLAVGRLRNKLEPDPKSPRYLLTVRGEGYQLVVPEVDDLETLLTRGEALVERAYGVDAEAAMLSLVALFPQLELLSQGMGLAQRARVTLLRAAYVNWSGQEAPVEALWQLADALDSDGEKELASRCAAHALSGLERGGTVAAALAAGEGWLARMPKAVTYGELRAEAEFRLVYTIILVLAGRLDQAVLIGRAGLRLAQRVGARRLEGGFQGRAGAIAVRRGNDRRALMHFVEAARCFIKVGALREFVRLMQNVGVFHYRRRRLDTARVVLEQTVEWMDQVNYPRGAAYARLNLGTVLLASGQSSGQAVQLATASLQWLSSANDLDGRFLAALMLARAALEEARWDASSEHLAMAGFLAEQCGNSRYQGHTLRYQGWLEHRLERDVGDRYQRAIELLKPFKSERLAMGSTCLWASALADAGEREALLREAAEALSVTSGAAQATYDAVYEAVVALSDYDALRTRALLGEPS